ncbi:MAG: hypothetical protein ACI8ZM_002709 [Crocinitomix sp.]|jgi:hypothetical protein
MFIIPLLTHEFCPYFINQGPALYLIVAYDQLKQFAYPKAFNKSLDEKIIFIS